MARFQYNSFVRRLVRLAILLLAFAIAGGPGLLDGCLVSCQPDGSAKTARSGHCHTAPASAPAAHLSAVPHCCRDTRSGLIETTDTSRLGVHSSAAVPLTAFDASAVFVHDLLVPTVFTPLSVLESNPTPLRV